MFNCSLNITNNHSAFRAGDGQVQELQTRCAGMKIYNGTNNTVFVDGFPLAKDGTYCLDYYPGACYMDSLELRFSSETQTGYVHITRHVITERKC